MVASIKLASQSRTAIGATTVGTGETGPPTMYWSPYMYAVHVW